MNRWACVAVSLLGTCAMGCHRDSSSSAAPATATAPPLPVKPHVITRPKQASLELVVYTSKPKAETAKLVTPSAIVLALTPELCGDEGACARVRAFVANGEHFRSDTESVAAAPTFASADLLAVATRGLSDAERDSLAHLSTRVSLSATGDAGPDQIPARAGFAAAAALAKATGGLVFDPDIVRFENATGAARHAITSPLGLPAFRSNHIVVHAYRQDDGTARLVSLGMGRFGAPDLEVVGAAFSRARPLGVLLNTVADALVRGGPALQAPLSIAIEDVARSVGKKPEDVHAGKKPSIPLALDLQEVPREKGDSDNALVRLVPPGGATAAAYEDALAGLLGEDDDPVTRTDHDEELLAASHRAQAALPGVLARFKQTGDPGATLFVKLPFAIPGRPEGSNEWMWVEVLRWDDQTITGTLGDAPQAVPQMKAGDKVTGKRADVFDYMLHSSDGGMEGGETSRILERRGH